MNEIMALKLICTKPSDLKREDLKNYAWNFPTVVSVKRI